MPRFIPYSYDQLKLIPVDFRSQIQPGTFEFTLNLIIDEDIDPKSTCFCCKYR